MVGTFQYPEALLLFVEGFLLEYLWNNTNVIRLGKWEIWDVWVFWYPFLRLFFYWLCVVLVEHAPYFYHGYVVLNSIVYTKKISVTPRPTYQRFLIVICNDGRTTEKKRKKEKGWSTIYTNRSYWLQKVCLFCSIQSSGKSNAATPDVINDFINK